MGPAIEVMPTRTLTRVWGDEVIVAETPQYLGKVLRMRAGTAGGLQYHVEKDETQYLLSGLAYVDHDDGRGQLVRVTVNAGSGFRFPPGAVHRVTAITDCVWLETSTPQYEDRVRVEAAYGEPEVGGLPSTWGPDTARSLPVDCAAEVAG